MSGGFMRKTTSIILYLEHTHLITVVFRYRSVLTDVDRNEELMPAVSFSDKSQMRTKNGGQSTQKEPQTQVGSAGIMSDLC
jgi:hypothetical protein